MKPLIRGLGLLAVTALVLAAFAGASIYAAGGLASIMPGETAPSTSAAAGNGTSSAGNGSTVAGWRIEEGDDSFQDDARYRIIRIERRVGDRSIVYSAQLSPWSPDRWDAYFSGSTVNAEGPCSVVDGQLAGADWPAPAMRAQAMRALLDARLGTFERDCGVPAGSMAPLLEGFEAAFADLAARHARWRANVEASGPPEEHIG